MKSNWLTLRTQHQVLQGISLVLPLSDIVGEFDFGRDVLTSLRAKGSQYSPPRGENTLFCSVFPHFLNSPTISLSGG